MTTSEVKLKGVKWFFVGLCTLSSIGWIFLLFTADTVFERSDHDEPVADVGLRTPYVDEVAAALRADAMYVDPLLADTVGHFVDTDGVRAAVEASETPVFVSAVPTQGFEPQDDRVLLSRIASATDRDGVYLLYDERGHVEYLKRGLGERLYLYPDYESSSETAVRTLVEAVDDAVENERERDKGSDYTESPLVMGGFMGLTFAVPLWYLMKFIRWSARRDRSYLKGFKE
ncbi:glycosyltransferase family protein [Nocardioides jensenii]|uniref:hypothetical protein n=1 Tax=Nocardioides jensenii TaxID=1843 RepID=UPI000836D1AF|nr:hypothetical protein [Nocardioides jensenii]